jgi:hypothetical protein
MLLILATHFLEEHRTGDRVCRRAHHNHPPHKSSRLLEAGFRELPEDFESFVQAEFLVACDHRDLFAHRLGDDLAVERVRVV